MGTAMQLTKINDELRDLKDSDPFLPRNLDTTRRLEVVPDEVLASCQLADGNQAYQYMTTCTVKLRVIGTHCIDVSPASWI